jgi:hypothetical protein
VVVADDDEQLSVDDIVVLNKEHERAEHLVWPSVGMDSPTMATK